jgi:NAD(P)-dependent dehydrogenase (short-subunit alcohol dehydrogenase family)
VAYNVSKHGVVGLVRCMAADHAADGVRVNAVCPGMIDTPMLRSIPADELADRLKSNVFARPAEPLEIAYEILHLASDESSFVTGATVAVDAGTTSVLR